MQKLLLAAMCLTLLAGSSATAQEKPATSTTHAATAKGEKMKGKHGKHQTVVKKTEVKKTLKKNSK